MQRHAVVELLVLLCQFGSKTQGFGPGLWDTKGCAPGLPLQFMETVDDPGAEQSAVAGRISTSRRGR